MTDTRPATRVNPELPWPGLAPYAEADAAFFFGRSRETAELLRLVQRDPFVLLTGAAGIGKTSLLLAGLFPALRTAEFLPVHVRIDFGDAAGEAPLSRQVLDALVEAARVAGIDGGRISETDSLWEAFHRAGQRWWSVRQQVLVPVLVLDQAEELFTIGRDSLRRRQRTDRLLEELSQLVENRAPARVATLLETGEDKHDSFDFESAPVRIVLSIREEALAHILPLRGLFPSMGRSELRLLAFNPAQAREAIAKPAATNALLGDGAADAIVRFLSGGSGAELPVPPCVLGILGRELAIECQRRGVAKITPEMLPERREQLPHGLYERAFLGLSAGARRFIEDDLVTTEGTRASCLVEDAVKRPEITAAVLATLAERQLLFFTGPSSAPRVELSSELLCPIATASRNAAAITGRDAAAARDRTAFEENAAALRRAVASNHRWAIVFAVLAAIALAAAGAGVVLWILAQQKLEAEREHAAMLRDDAAMLHEQPREPAEESAPNSPGTVPVPVTPAPASTLPPKPQAPSAVSTIEQPVRATPAPAEPEADRAKREFLEKQAGQSAPATPPAPGAQPLPSAPSTAAFPTPLPAHTPAPVRAPANGTRAGRPTPPR
jgi:hypothetical protein